MTTAPRVLLAAITVLLCWTSAKAARASDYADYNDAGGFVVAGAAMLTLAAWFVVHAVLSLAEGAPSSRARSSE